MFGYQITKYNPIHRNSLGHYLKDEWSSICHIGRIYENREFTLDEYLKVEDAHIEAILLFMAFLNLESLPVTYLEKTTWDNNTWDSKGFLYSKSMLELYKKIKVGKQISTKEMGDAARLVLRELLWCKIENQSMLVNFCDDYYMFIGSPKEISKSLKKKIESLGLFVEEFELSSLWE